MPEESKTEVPEEFLCEMTKKIMLDPMVSRYGTHFEREAILKWLNDGNNYCPVTGQGALDERMFCICSVTYCLPFVEAGLLTGFLNFSPALRPSNLVSDKNLQWKIQFWAQKNGRDDIVLKPEDEESNFAAKIQVSAALPPEWMLCPITKDIMSDPVMTKFGNSYERKAILRRIEKGEADLLTGKPIHASDICTNHKLAFDIKQWRLHYGEGYDEMTRLEIESKTVKATMISQGYQTADILKALVLEHVDEEKVDSEDNRKMSAEDVMNAFDEIDDIVG